MAMKVQCQMCPNECVLENGQHSRCRARMNKDGRLYSLVYGKPCAVHVYPIEKNPFFHFLPGTTAFSIATAGCVLSCKFCQNWQISQAKPEDTDTYDLPPDKVVGQAISHKCKSVTYTYTEPTVFYEYMYDTAVIAGKQCLKNTMHSCGYIKEMPLRKLSKHMDAADIDLKAFTEDFYARICNGSLKPVLNSLVVLKEEGVWLEITNLVIPTLNDDLKNIREMCRWIVKNLGADVPIHFSRFFPNYKLTNLPPTPVETLTDARKTAMDAGLKFVYIGNIRHDGEKHSVQNAGSC
jgi:pyruvate formate lyase activating enzyme